MFISVILGMIFSGVQGHPVGYPEYGTTIISYATAAPGTTFVAGMSAMLNITYTLMFTPIGDFLIIVDKLFYLRLSPR
jgi:hypothetical protein